jgi:hypothetical protein
MSSAARTHAVRLQNLVAATFAALMAAATLAQDPTPMQWRSDQGGNGHWYQLLPLCPNLDNYPANPSCGTVGVTGALTSATQRNAHLVTLHSQAEHNFVHAMIATRYQYYQSFRVLTNGIRTSSGYAWRNGEPFSFSIFSGSAPVNPVGSPIIFGCGPNNAWCPTLATGCWMTYPESLTDKYHLAVLEWDADCNNDGVVDFGQIRDGTLADANANNIPDCCEQGTACGTPAAAICWNPSDGGNGHWYEAVTTGGTTITWAGSRDAALARGGHLASFETNAEFQFIAPLFASRPTLWTTRGNYARGPWIGAYQDHAAPGFVEPAGGWVWVTGVPVSSTFFSAFGQGNPNNFPCCEDFLQIGENYLTTRVNDQPEGGNAIAYLVEYDADCNNDGMIDYGQIRAGTVADVNGNNIPDCCESPLGCCPGDVNGDRLVNGADVGILLGYWGNATPTTPPAVDINRDGVVNGADLGILLSAWGSCGN